MSLNVLEHTLEEHLFVFRKRVCALQYLIHHRTLGPEVLGQMFGGKHSSRTLHKRMLDGVLQLPDVARPGIVHQHPHRLLRNPLDGLARLRVELSDEVIHQERNILPPLGQ